MVNKDFTMFYNSVPKTNFIANVFGNIQHYSTSGVMIKVGLALF